MDQIEKLERMKLAFEKAQERWPQIYQELLDIAERKGHDYAGDKDALSNFADFGWRGIVVRLGDKFSRLKNFVYQGSFKVKDESVRDTFLDHINYAALGLIMYEEQQKQGGDSAGWCEK